MLATYVFSETSPSAPGTAASSAAVQNSASWATAGVAGGMLDDAEAVDIVAELVGATGGALDVYVQSASTKDGSGNDVWFDLVHYTQLAAGAGAVKYRTQVTQTAQPASAAPVTIGKNTSPALAAGTAIQSAAFDRLRLLFVAGSGTSAGAAVTVTVTAAQSVRRGR